MNNTQRIASLEARMDSFDAKLDRLIAAVEPKAPARVTRKPVTRRPAAPKAVTRKSDLTVGTGLSRKEWNRTLTTLAKTQPKGSGAYQAVLAAWSDVQVMRTAGATPADALAWVLEG